jgi:carbonic anhydrase/acetyltransferase-like protein (isoleucine patch superfamily)
VSFNQLLVDQPQPEIARSAVILGEVHVGAGAVLAQGLVVLVPPGTVIPAGSVLVGRPPHVIRSATDADRERLAVLRQHQINLTDHPGIVVRRPTRAGEHMGTLYAYRDKTPAIGAGTVLFDSAEIIGDVVIGEGSLIGAGVKIIGDSHATGAESVVRAGACVKQRDQFGDRSILDGFPATLAGTLTGPPPLPGWALPPDAVATLRRVQR